MRSALFETYAKAGDNAELKDWAGKALPHLKEHLSMAEKLRIVSVHRRRGPGVRRVQLGSTAESSNLWCSLCRSVGR